MEKLIEQEGLEMLLQTFQLIAPLPVAFFLRLSGMLKQERLPKNSRILKEGEIARRIYFIVSGLARAWYTDAHGKPRTSWFMKEGDVMISVHSFFTGKPSHENIFLCENALLYSITKRQLDTLYGEFNEFNEHGRILTERYYIRAEERAILMRIPKVKNRYEHLMKEEPELFKRVPLTQIASYLGTTKETLSRIRAGRTVDLHQQAS